MKVLITSGGTREPIDAARFITNLSTGYTGRLLAEALAARGCEVLCLCAAGAIRPSGDKVRVEDFFSFADLDGAIKKAFKAEPFDAVVHLAAVSDYSPSYIEADGRGFLPGRATKLDSSPQELRLTLRRNFKILDRIKTYAEAANRPKPLLVGFKLTAGAPPEKVLEKVRALASADLVVHNDLAEINGAHPFHVYRGGVIEAHCAGHAELAERLYGFISGRTEVLCC
ncbi:MAG: phosphopantothenoylcysteine decarboxylase [Elusimicrobiales bacterium]|nr:phosphopantothenoylcysteine decarboxylase [Elusimicrobiales bacterium]